VAKSPTKREAAALIVGISHYASAGVARLKYADRDARALARTLHDPDVCNFPPERVVLLTNEKARREAIVRRLSRWLPEAGRGAELVVLYLAGHGMVQRVGDRDEGYFLPVGAGPEDLVARGIAMSDVTRWVEAIEAKAVLFCLDCCHAARALERQGEGHVVARAVGLRPAVLPELSGEGRFVIASCRGDEPSLESPELKHGLFTYYLLKGIRGEADENRDDKVGIGELFEYVAREVRRAALEQFGREQTPWTRAVNAGGVFISMPKKRPPPEAPAEFVSLWQQDRVGALRWLEQQLPQAEEASLLSVLRLLRRQPDPTAIPVLFRCLSLSSETVRRAALEAVDAIGWPKTSARVEELARQADPEMPAILEGLAAFEASGDLVALLDRLALRLQGGLRERAIHLLGRKRLGLDLEKTSALLEQFNIPYRIVRALGLGLFTAAYLARNTETETDAVVRVLRPEFAAQPEVRGLFVDLVRRSFSMVHQNLVRTLDVRALPDHNFYFCIRDHVEGVTLQKLATSDKRFEPLQVLKILRQLVEALTPWHRVRLPHGGVKPSNIFVCEEDQVVLGDASLSPREVPVNNERMVYDYRYAAVEWFRDRAAPGPAADFYSLGCVAYELFCGRPPFVSNNHFELAALHSREVAAPPSAHGATIGASGDAFVLRLLSKEVSSRFSSIDAVLAALDELRAAWTRRPKPPLEAPPALPPDTKTPLRPSTIVLLDRASLKRYASKVSVLRPSEANEDQQGSQPLAPDEAVPWFDSIAVGPDGQEASPTVDPDKENVPAAANDLQKSAEESPAAEPDEEVRMTDILRPGEHTAVDVMSLSADPPLGSGATVPGYEVLSVVGRGGMGVIYKARQVSLNRVVALKMILVGGHAGEEELGRFRAEAEAIARLQHPNIVQIFEVGKHHGTPYFAMEFVGGGNLAMKLHGDPLPAVEAAVLLRALSEATHHAHERGVVHRDLKPANVLLSEDGTPKITDFGLAKRLDEERGQTRSGTIMGSPSYMAPEQAQGKRDLGPAADVYALGAILYECLTGRPPFRAARVMDTLIQVISEEPVRPRQLQPSLPLDLETICLKCLEKEARRRYASASELAEDLRRFLANEPIRARRAGVVERLWKFIRRKPMTAAFLVLLVLLVLQTLAAFLLFWH
jgi:serine/threonine protein kinase